MARQAKIRAADGVLLEHGFVDYGVDGVVVKDDFSESPFKVRWNGQNWIPHNEPPIIDPDKGAWGTAIAGIAPGDIRDALRILGRRGRLE